jgi:hypothetical protein
MMEQVMECLLAKVKAIQAKIDANQAKMGFDLKEMKEEMLARLEAMIQNNHDKMMARLDAHHERMMARMDSQVEKVEACQEKTETMDLEANPEEIGSESEHQEVPSEEAAVKTFGSLKE